MLKDMLFLGLAGAIAGVARATMGFISTATSWKDFEAFQFFRTVAINALIGAGAGAVTDSYGAAISAGLMGEQLVKTIIKRATNGSPEIAPPVA